MPLEQVLLDGACARSQIRISKSETRNKFKPEGERRKGIYPWGELPACLWREIRKLEAYATVWNQLPRV